MIKYKRLSATSDEVDKAFGVLDDALRSRGRVLATDEESIKKSDSEIDLESVELPESLRDPMDTLQRGREILESGFSAHRHHARESDAAQHLAQAARNGQDISEEIRRRMREDRRATKTKMKMKKA